MNPRTTGIVFLVAAALFAFVYFYEIRGEEGRKEAEEAQKQLFTDVAPDDVEIVSITTTDGRDAMLERRNGGWRLTSPVDFPADELAADGMASAIAEVKSESVFEEPQGPEVYGLDDDDKEIQFTAAGKARTLRFGSKTPVGSNTYAKTGDADAVYAVPTHRADTFRKSLDDLRDKRILRFETSAIDRVEASWPGGGLVLEKADGTWRITAPIEADADQDTVNDLLSDLSFLRATGFVDSPPPDAETGLDDPSFAVVLQGAVAGEEEGGEEAEATPVRITFEVGADLDGATRLARAGEPVLYRIPAERIDDFPRDAAVYRFRRLADYAATRARRIEIVFHTAAGETIAITGSRDDSGWSSAPESFQPGKLASLVSEVSRLRADRVLADAAGDDELAGLGLDPPNALYRIYGDADGGEEGEEASEVLLAEIHLGALQGSDGIVARTAEREEIFRLPLGLAEHMPVSHEAFENRFRRELDPAPADTAEATGVPPFDPELDLGRESP